MQLMGRKKKAKKRKDEAEIIREYHQRIGKMGGQARAKKLSPERRKEIAGQGARKRWKKPDGEESS
jgi:hypothetical protein